MKQWGREEGGGTRQGKRIKRYKLPDTKYIRYKDIIYSPENITNIL